MQKPVLSLDDPPEPEIELKPTTKMQTIQQEP